MRVALEGSASPVSLPARHLGLKAVVEVNNNLVPPVKLFWTSAQQRSYECRAT